LPRMWRTTLCFQSPWREPHCLWWGQAFLSCHQRHPGELPTAQEAVLAAYSNDQWRPVGGKRLQTIAELLCHSHPWYAALGYLHGVPRRVVSGKVISKTFPFKLF
jgi:hypothetical protein